MTNVHKSGIICGIKEKGEVMKIGFDTDGPLFNTDEYEIKHGLKYFKKLYCKTHFKKTGEKIKAKNISDDVILKNSNGYGIKEKFAVSKEDEISFWTKHLIPYILFCKPNRNAAKYIQMLKGEGIEAINVSARAKASEKSIVGFIIRTLTKFSYLKNGLKFDKIIFVNTNNAEEEKARVCNREKLEMFLDDKKEVIDKINKSSFTKCLCFTTVNNKNHDISSENRIDKMYDFYVAVRNFRDKKTGFKILNREELDNIESQYEKDVYYSNLRKHYQETTYNKKYIQKREKSYIRLVRVIKFFFDKIVKFKVIGRENLPNSDGMIIAMNHRDYLDTSLVYSIMNKRPTHVLSKIELENEFVGKLLDRMGSITTDRHNPVNAKFSTNESIRMVLNGSNTLIAVEGKRNKTEKRLLNFKLGAVYNAQKTGAPIVSFVISKDGPSGKDRIVRICEPLYVSNNEDLNEANLKLRNIFEKALDENEKQKTLKLKK